MTTNPQPGFKPLYQATIGDYVNEPELRAAYGKFYKNGDTEYCDLPDMTFELEHEKFGGIVFGAKGWKRIE